MGGRGSTICISYVALTDFNSGKKGDLAFLKGDILSVSNSNLEKNWWTANNLRTHKKGLVPRNFIILLDKKGKDCEFYFNITPKECCLKLMLARSTEGTFLIRPRLNSDLMVLCLKYRESNDELNIANYIIYENTNKTIYIFPEKCFENIFDLIGYYAENCDLRCLLMKPYSDCYAVPPLNEYEISRNQISIKEQIGSGAFSTVYKGLWNAKLEVAIKVITDNKTSKAVLQREAIIIQKLQHPYILQLIGICSKVLPMYIITEYLKFGNIKHFFTLDASQEISEDHLVQMIFQVAQGMEYLVGMKIVHRDLRGDNILVSDDYSPKISDFGLARIVKDDVYVLKSQVVQFAMKWAAPEIINAEKIIFDEKTDIWSFGIACYEILSRGDVPYKDQNAETVMYSVKNKEIMKFPSEFNCSTKIKTFLKTCWAYNPEERPTFIEIVESLRKLHSISKDI